MTQAIPPGHERVIPHLVFDDTAAALEFYKKAFGAEEITRAPSPDGAKIMHASMRIGDQIVYLCDDFPEFSGGKGRTPAALGGSPVTLHQFVPDCDAAIQRAEKAGAIVTMPPQDMFWGDRYATITDPFGHTWSFATHIRDVSAEEVAEASKAAFT